MAARVDRRVGLVVGAVGVALRAQLFLAGRSLWLDEAMLANNITHRSFGGLLRPLANEQGAPVLFLWLERAAIVVLGDGERVLRLLPFLAGLAVLALTWLVGRRLLGSRMALVALALVALSPSLVRYSNEVKQYSSDAAIALGLVLLALLVLDGVPRALPGLVAAGAVAPWASHPAAFVVAGIGIVLVWGPLRRRDLGALRPLVVVGAVWLASLALDYVVSLRRLGHDDALLAYWRAGFAPRPLGVSSSVRWIGAATSRFGADPTGLRFGMLALVLGMAGTVALARRRPAGLVLVASVPILLVAAIARGFPFQGRVVLFLVPLMFLVLAAVVSIRSSVLRRIGCLGLAVLAVAPVTTTTHRLADPLPFPAAREVLTFVRDHRQPTDQLWLVTPATPPYEYYAVRLGLRAQRQLDWGPDRGQCDSALGANHTGRVWVVHAYTYAGRPGQTGDRVRSHLDAVARRVMTHVTIDASATLYDFAAPATDPDGRRVDRGWGRACLHGTPLAPVAPSGLRAGPLGRGGRT